MAGANHSVRLANARERVAKLEAQIATTEARATVLKEDARAARANLKTLEAKPVTTGGATQGRRARVAALLAAKHAPVADPSEAGDTLFG